MSNTRKSYPGDINNPQHWSPTAHFVLKDLKSEEVIYDTRNSENVVRLFFSTEGIVPDSTLAMLENDVYFIRKIDSIATTKTPTFAILQDQNVVITILVELKEHIAHWFNLDIKRHP